MNVQAIEMEQQPSETYSASSNPNSESKSLNILLVSDIHNSFGKLEKLKTWYDQNPQKFDYVFGLGDFDSIRPEPGDPVDQQNNDYSEITKMLTSLDYFSAPVIYIPGNHDPIRLHTESPKLTPNSILVQNSSTIIGENLQVIGLGGSLPGFWEKDMEFELNRDSYPYNGEDDMGKDLNKLVAKYCNPKIQTILLTHTGPFYSSTTIIYRPDKKRNLWLGCKELDKILKRTELSILMNIHGHSHPSVGRANFDKVQIINPGSLVDMNIGTLLLEKRSASQKWAVKKTEFINLNSYTTSM